MPKGSQLVVLESTARADDGAAYRQIQEQAVQAAVFRRVFAQEDAVTLHEAAVGPSPGGRLPMR